MRTKFTIILLLLAILNFSCHDDTKVKRVLLDYTFDNGWTNSYSIKIYTDGAAYLKKSTLRVDSFYSNQINAEKLNQIVRKLREAKIDSKYEDTHIQDASSFNVIVYDESAKPSKYQVYGNKYPEILNNIKNYVETFSKQKDWHQLKDTMITFSSFTNFRTTPKMDTSLKFLPPKTPKK